MFSCPATEDFFRARLDHMIDLRHRMDRCHLKGETGDRLHAVLCAAGYNIKWLLRMIAKRGVTFAKHLFLRLFGHEYQGAAQGLRSLMNAPLRWWAMLKLSDASTPPSPQTVNHAF